MRSLLCLATVLAIGALAPTVAFADATSPKLTRGSHGHPTAGIQANTGCRNAAHSSRTTCRRHDPITVMPSHK
jgi:hypothetical protein